MKIRRRGVLVLLVVLPVLCSLAIWAVPIFVVRSGMIEHEDIIDIASCSQNILKETSLPFQRVTVESNNLSYFLNVPVDYHKDVVSKYLISRGKFEQNEINNFLEAMNKIRRYLQWPKHKMVFLDIGANIGLYGILFAKIGYTVHMFEAYTVNQESLFLSICENGLRNVSLHPVALGQSARTCDLWSHEENILDGTIVCENEQLSPKMIVRKSVRIETLDNELYGFTSILEDALIFIKLDVEGFEHYVLEGALNTLKNKKPLLILMELLQKNIHHALQMLHFLEDMGYEFSTTTFMGPRVDLQTVKRSQVDQNLYLTHKGINHL